MLCLLMTGAAVAGQGQPPPVKINVDSILAIYSRPNLAAGRPAAIKMDPRLISSGLAWRLEAMFDCKDYRLMRSQHDASAFGGAVAFNLPGGHILQVAPLQQEEDGGIALGLALFEGERLVMQLPFKMITGGALMLVDQHFPNRLYITAISINGPPMGQGTHSVNAPQPPILPEMPIPAWIPAE
jgi:hypothetical protein